MPSASQLISSLILILFCCLDARILCAQSQKDFQILSEASTTTVSKPLYDPGLNASNASRFQMSDGSSVSTLDPTPMKLKAYAYRKDTVDPEVQKLVAKSKDFFASENKKRNKLFASLQGRNLSGGEIAQKLNDFRAESKERQDRFQKGQNDALRDILCSKEDKNHPSDACQKRDSFLKSLLSLFS